MVTEMIFSVRVNIFDIREEKKKSGPAAACQVIVLISEGNVTQKQPSNNLCRHPGGTKSYFSFNEKKTYAFFFLIHW